MKYYRLSQNGENINVVIAVEDDQVEKAEQALSKAGYEYEECEKPDDAQLRQVMLGTNNPPPQVLTNPYPVFDNEKRVYHSGPCCARCKNRFKRNSWCDSHSYQEKCYRFNLEK